jgi:hypothetical protein
VTPPSAAAGSSALKRFLKLAGDFVGRGLHCVLHDGGADDAAALAEAAGPDGIHVILDYLLGAPTEAITSMAGVGALAGGRLAGRGSRVLDEFSLGQTFRLDA